MMLSVHRVLFLLVVFAFALVVVRGQNLDPNQQLIPPKFGFFRGNADAKIHLELFGDLLCVDTKDDWNNVMSHVLAQFTPEQVLFIYHPFPLPYHHNAFFAARAAYAVDNLKPGSFIDFAIAVYAVQDSFLTGAVNMTEPQVIDAFATLALNKFSIPKATFMNEFSKRELDLNTRAQFKLSASRGVTGTPTYMLNGVPILAGTFTINDWVLLIKQYLQAAGDRTTGGSVTTALAGLRGN